MATLDAPLRSSSGGWADALRHAIPAGTGLSEDLWRGRHRGIVALAWLHAVAVPTYGVIQGQTRANAALETGPIALFALIATVPVFQRRMRAAAASAALLTSSALLVHFSHGLIEMHFHFFVMVPIIALYQDWVPFLLSIGYVLVHHGLVGQLAPGSVFNHPWGQRHPWEWAGVHAFFIAGTSAVCLATWRLNEATFARQRRAERDLIEEKRVVETLHTIGTGIVAELDIDRVAQLVTDEAVKATGAAFGAFFYNVLGDEGESYMLYTLSGAPRSAFASFPMPRNTKVFDPTFSGTGVVRIDDVTADPRYGQNEPYHGMPPGHLPVRSYLAVPVRSRGSTEVLGGLFFGHAIAAMFTEQDERIAVGIATQAAIAFDNARLYQAEREAHQTADAARARLSLLAEAARLLAVSLDADTSLNNVAKLSVPSIADACMIDVLEDDGTIKRVAVHAIPALAEFVEPLRGFPPDRANDAHPVVQVIDGIAGVLQQAIGADLIERATRSEEHADLVGRMNQTSSITVPMPGRGTVLGAITFVTTAASHKILGPDDLQLAQELGMRVGLAIENVTLYNQQRSVAESLQHALLPQKLPSIPGFETTARYLPGTPGERVGGDWYDLFEIPSGEIAIVMGDVVGHGIPAASLMAQLRHALRAYVWDGMEPSAVLTRLNHLLYGLERDGMATITLGLLDPISNELRVANGGHPPLLHLRDGDAEFVGWGLGPPLGAVPFARFRQTRIDLRPKDTAVFYTDGLIEDRTESLDVGLERMRRAASNGAQTIDALCDDLLRTCIGERVVEDDVAVLALRSIPLGATLSLQLPAEPHVLASLRQTLRRWLHENDVDESDVRDILIACGEACNNAIEHGSSSMNGTFEIEAAISASQEIGITVRLVVRNAGSWRAPRADGGGRGLPLMEKLMDTVDIARGPDGIEVQMQRRLLAAPVGP